MVAIAIRGSKVPVLQKKGRFTLFHCKLNPANVLPSNKITIKG